MQPIPLNDLNAQHVALRNELDAVVERVVRSSRFIGGEDLEAFSDEYAAFCGVKRVVPCSSGTDALALAILGICGLGDGTREIITVSFTFPATVEVIALLGYKPVLIDIEPDTCMMDLELLASAITAKTAAIIPVHLFGHMLPIDELVEMADRRGVPVIEDAAQAHGASWRGLRPGQSSAAATFSFFPGKNLGAWGDAGAVVTRDEPLANHMKSLADHGRVGKYKHTTLGLNARMDNLQAAILRVKLRRLEEWNAARRRAAKRYTERLADLGGCTPLAVRDEANHVYHQYVVRAGQRQCLIDGFNQNGIGHGIHYAVPVHKQPAFSFLGLSSDALPNSTAAAGQVLSLPMFPHITDEQIERVCSTIRSATLATSVA